jgi:thioredoxin reductase (NADPH)
MKRMQLIITLLLLALLLVLGFALPAHYGAVPWFGWIVWAVFALCLGSGFVAFDTARLRRRILAPVTAAQPLVQGTSTLLPVSKDPNRPPYPHPVINPQTCIGCHACVEACPHDVLAMVNGVAGAIAIDQCVEDISCQVECPTNPKSCIVVNTSKKLPERQTPRRNQQFMTDVPGLYLVGDVSGVPLIKNAINEGGDVIEHIAKEIKQASGQAENPVAADYDVAIIGIGPAGLSATVRAKELGLSYIALEQGQALSAIQQAYQAGKLVYFKPDEVDVTGGIPLPDAPAPKETMIQMWQQALNSHQLHINEYERCTGIGPDGDAFSVRTLQEKTGQQVQYQVRRVVLAIGNRGTPMRLQVPGEELKIEVTPTEPVLPAFCDRCGEKRLRQANFCRECGAKYVRIIPPPFADDKVKYRLSDPNHYQGKHCLVVGAGNSAVEAAVDLAAYRSADGGQIIGWRDNTVSLVIRSDFRSDLKLGNKMLIYECIDEGKLKVYFGATVKEVTATEVALVDTRARDAQTAPERARFKNDYVFALIGGDKPTRFLTSLGIQVG